MVDIAPRAAPAPPAPPIVRPVTGADVPALRRVIDATGLFPSALLDGMLAAYLGTSGREPTSAGDGRSAPGGLAATDERWLTVDAPLTDGTPTTLGAVAVAYAAPERMTDGTWNAYLLAVHPTHQGRGVGAALMRHLERTLAAEGARVLLVETSGLPAFARTRAFYRGIGYVEEARIREFYAAGEDKVVFWKRLEAPR